VDSIFNYFDITPDRLKRSFIETYHKNSIYSNLIFRSIVSLLSLPLKPQKKSIKYFFWGTRYSDIISGLPKSKICILGGPNQLKYCIKNRYYFIPIMDIWSLLYRYLKYKDKKYLDILEDKVIKKVGIINIYKSDVSYLILDNDNLPMHRFMIEVAKRSNIVTISIQHGIFNTSEASKLHDGWTADYFLTMNQHQTDLLIKKGMPNKKLITMGFHSVLNYPDRRISKINNRKICFLGQPYDKFNNNLADRYYHILQNIQNFCIEKHIDFIYKPHPWEDIKSLPKWLKNIKMQSLDSVFNQNDVFISLTSTALFEASWVNRVSVQIYDEIFETDRYSELGNIITIDYNTIDFEAKLYNAINSSISKIKKDYNLLDSFLESIALIENKIKENKV